MPDYRMLERHFMQELRLQRRPVVVAFSAAPPENIRKFNGSVPSGCTFWKLAAEGDTFYTLAEDHFNCPIGSYTHNVPLPPDRARDLEQVLGLMARIGYVRMEEIPRMFRLPETPKAVIYAPLGEAPVEPAAVIFAGSAARMMVLMEAAGRAGVASQLPLLTRPTCMAIPASLGRGAVASAGCIGNRTYTGIEDGELYVVAQARDLQRLASELSTAASANAALAEYHRGRLDLVQIG